MDGRKNLRFFVWWFPQKNVLSPRNIEEICDLKMIDYLFFFWVFQRAFLFFPCVPNSMI